MSTNVVSEIFANNSLNFRTFMFDECPVGIVNYLDDIWFNAQDICNILCLGNVQDLFRLLSEHEISFFYDNVLRRTDEVIINHLGLHTISGYCKNNKAKRLKNWVVDDIIPALTRENERKKNIYKDSNNKEKDNVCSDKLQKSRFVLSFDSEFKPVLQSVPINSCVIDPGDRLALSTFIEEIVADDCLSLIIEAAVKRLSSYKK